MALSVGYERKQALIIGINRYHRDKLVYCENDATDLRDTLESIEFNVSLGINCDRKEFIDMVETFVAGIKKTDLILFYFAGHGKQHGDQNYLLPSDYDYDNLMSEDKHIADHAVNAQYIMKKIDDRNCRITIYLFDCCRNYVRTRAIDMSQGLSPMRAPPETLIAFSCAPGEATLDETRNNRNGIFIENLLKHIAKPNKDIEAVLKSVSREVKRQTGGYQKPYRTSTLTEEIFLVTKYTGVIVAGGNGNGNRLEQLSYPSSLCVDDAQTIYATEWNNHRVREWKYGAKSGQMVAGGNGAGNRIDQLNCPTDVIVNKERDSLIICDRGNKRVVRWPLRGGKSGQTIISDIDCNGLTMDDRGFLYVSDTGQNYIKRWRVGDISGTVVAGGNGKGNRLNQLNDPYYIFVDKDHSIYVSDNKNHRVMKWVEGATEGIVVIGDRGQGNGLTQLSNPLGVIVDQLGTVYVSDGGNARIIRWPKGATQGSVIVGGNGEGKEANELNWPNGLSFDRHGNLYVVEENNHRVQKFNINPNLSS